MEKGKNIQNSSKASFKLLPLLRNCIIESNSWTSLSYNNNISLLSMRSMTIWSVLGWGMSEGGEDEEAVERARVDGLLDHGDGGDEAGAEGGFGGFDVRYLEGWGFGGEDGGVVHLGGFC